MGIRSKMFGDFFGMLFWRAFYFRIRIYGMFERLIYLFLYVRGVNVGKKVKFLGFPRIRRYPNSTISIGNNCELNSATHSVLEGLLKPCTFITLNGNSEIILGDNVGITGSVIVAGSKVRIGNNVRIGANCTIVDTDFHHPRRSLGSHDSPVPTRPVTIEDDVFLGYNCVILKGVTIGENSVIGANSVVTNSIPKNTIAIGNPCKVVIHKKW